MSKNRGVGVRLLAVCVTGAVSMFALTAGAASGNPVQYAAGFCHAEGPNSLDRINYDSGLVNNNAGSGNADIMCPIDVGPVYFDPTTKLKYVDNSSSANLTCTHSWNDTDGDPYWSWTFTSSGSSSSLKSFVVADTEEAAYLKNWRCTLPPTTSVYITGYEYDPFM